MVIMADFTHIMVTAIHIMAGDIHITEDTTHTMVMAADIMVEDIIMNTSIKMVIITAGRTTQEQADQMQ